MVEQWSTLVVEVNGDSLEVVVASQEFVVALGGLARGRCQPRWLAGGRFKPIVFLPSSSPIVFSSLRNENGSSDNAITTTTKSADLRLSIVTAITTTESCPSLHLLPLRLSIVTAITTTKLLNFAIPHLSVTQFVTRLFESRNDLSTFKNHIRDFLVQSKEFSAQDNKDLYAEEVAAQRERKRQRMLTIPGLIAPNEIQDEMLDS
ncbi:hypothetical protein Vadar_023009 [Vaccinium darrowii]|uniref:Uncharacterized protein n=1 Tax=Vaccinium darrowii TaxID=229202 RepID=A0ACB7Y1V2_9ERIC|nr:hypothetical protein Vadar_023009 [Vaccinium darrowii]